MRVGAAEQVALGARAVLREARAWRRLQRRYEAVHRALHGAWRSCVQELLATLPAPAQQATTPSSPPSLGCGDPTLLGLLQRTGLHGCVLRVQECGTPRLVGREGVVVQASAKCVVLLDARDKLHGACSHVHRAARRRVGNTSGLS